MFIQEETMCSSLLDPKKRKKNMIIKVSAAYKSFKKSTKQAIAIFASGYNFDVQV